MKCQICNTQIKESKFYNGTFCSSACHTVQYWLNRIKNKDNPNQVVVGLSVYQIGDEESKSSFRGYYGQTFEIEFSDGRKVTTSNLWSNGQMPEGFKPFLPDNAKIYTVSSKTCDELVKWKYKKNEK